MSEKILLIELDEIKEIEVTCPNCSSTAVFNIHRGEKENCMQCPTCNSNISRSINASVAAVRSAFEIVQGAKCALRFRLRQT